MISLGMLMYVCINAFVLTDIKHKKESCLIHSVYDPENEACMFLSLSFSL